MKAILPGKSLKVLSSKLDRTGARSVAQREGDLSAVPPFKVSRILVPTDFSPYSRAALRSAVSLGQTFGAEITFLHVVPLDFSEGEFSLINYPFSKARLLRQAEEQLNEWLKREGTEPLRARTLVRLGPPVTEIVRVAAELGSDLIVLATRGHTVLSHILLGSTAEQVVRHSLCAVLTVREKGAASQIF